MIYLKVESNYQQDNNFMKNSQNIPDTFMWLTNFRRSNWHNLMDLLQSSSSEPSGQSTTLSHRWNLW
jgi:hypothetical protein